MMKNRVVRIAALLLLATAPPRTWGGVHTRGGRSAVFNVRDYGARGDGVHLDTAHIQAAIDAAVAAGAAAGCDAEATLAGLSKTLKQSLKACPAMRNVVYNGADLCFFPIENSKGYAGDETIRQLVGAIEGAAMELDSIKKQRVPAGWLAVYDELGRELSATPPRQQLGLAEVTAIASRCGLPHDPLRIRVPAQLRDPPRAVVQDLQHLRRSPAAPARHAHVHAERLPRARRVDALLALDGVPHHDARHPGERLQRRIQRVAVAPERVGVRVGARPHH